MNNEIKAALQNAANSLGPEFHNSEGYSLSAGKQIHWSAFGSERGTWYHVSIYGKGPAGDLRVIGTSVIPADAIDWKAVNA